MIITLLTDFGDADGFVGAMRGRLLTVAPEARLVDLAHHVPRGDVAKAAQVLRRSAPYFPPGCVHLIVVDPGVGSGRRVLVALHKGHTFVAPDNGVLGPTLDALGEPAQARIWSVTDPALTPWPVSHTFHGRDIFAPVAGAIAAGHPVEAVGVQIDDSVRLPSPVQHIEGGWRRGAVVEIDAFGNAITDLAGHASVEIRLADGTRLSGPHRAYAEVERGAPVIIVSSNDTVEIAVREGDAAARFDLRPGAPVWMKEIS